MELTLQLIQLLLSNHGLVTGQKLFILQLLLAGGLSNNSIYYIVRVDENKFKLADNHYNSKLLKPVTVGITSLLQEQLIL